MSQLGSSRGDTLVEVVMAIALFSIAMITAYSVAYTSYRTGVSARERTQAAHLLQDQAEKMRRYRDQLAAQYYNDDTKTIISATYFPSGDTYMPIPATGTLTPAAGIYSSCTGLPSCQLKINSTVIPSASGPRFAKVTATISVTWTGFVGNDAQSSSITYTLTDTRAANVCDNALAGTCI
ncbi:MAG TPA: hypothetical protein VLF21_01705 [Candidatus Saccharimonadales bacterium]|nr:hypothetical protein [Candidatus Saccharimonadales bacterium]